MSELYDIVVYVSHMDCDQFDAYVKDTNLSTGGVEEGKHGYWFTFNNVTLIACAEMTFMLDVKITDMQGVLKIG
jgi:hypothetical protein